MFQNLFHYVLIATTLSTLKVSGVDGALARRNIALNGKISDIGQRIFEKSGMSEISEEEKLNIANEGWNRFQATLSDYDWDRSKVEKGQGSDHKKLKKAALKRKKGYITFEDGENDDHLHNIMACLYDNRIPEMIVIHGGNGELRHATYKWFWDAAHKLTGCDVPELLLGEKGTEEPSVFDSVEGMGGLEETYRQQLVANPMGAEKRKAIAQQTYKKVANHISKLDRVLIGLKTAPTDLMNVINLMNKVDPEKAKEKMFVVWSCPGAFSLNHKEFPLLARFNFYRNSQASDNLLKSGVNMVLTGNDLYATRVRGFVDAEFAEKMSTIDPKWIGIEGFEGLKDLSDKAPEGSIFGLYRTVQETFQARKVVYGERYLTYVIKPVRDWLEKLRLNPQEIETEKIERPGPDLKKSDLMSGEEIEDKLQRYEQEFGGKLKSILQDKNGHQKFTQEIEEMKKAMDDLDHREGHLVRRWKPFADNKHYLEGCTADPHLEFILNPNMRKSSVKEVIPVEVRRENPDRPGLLTIKVKKGSNCWVASDLDSTDFRNMYQGMINLFAEHKDGKLELPSIEIYKGAQSRKQGEPFSV
ncbi:uncharacterized protein MELLADRAFT_106088 [Melampsora larici-populina 98AG31]|uniref:Secreted protein n=1 Tax=Melampsora larici-populina (strain 98AG31 / pathotype 3-4-7) TaxID=747676 RepID=F4RKC4_MELLP|nr:uncharacterized protein MELLADRAFT_106088 [Melampsora larici-populina 98AG31]EGG07069.1 hypothetical protein MELLADRAFT_106088 [Melampsora larici-populina 98AG31]